MSKAVMSLPVAFGQMSSGAKTARIGVSIDRSNLTLAVADKTLCGKRLSVCLEWRQNGEHADQMTIPGIDRLRLEGVADVTRFGVSAEEITHGLTFAKGSINVGELSAFAQKSGVLEIVGIEAIPEDEEDDEEEEEGEEAASNKSRRKKSAVHEQDDSWRSMSIGEALGPDFSPSVIVKLSEAGIDMLGDLADLCKQGRSALTNLKGIGPAASEAIEQAFEDWRNKTR